MLLRCINKKYFIIHRDEFHSFLLFLGRVQDLQCRCKSLPHTISRRRSVRLILTRRSCLLSSINRSVTPNSASATVSLVWIGFVRFDWLPTLQEYILPLDAAEARSSEVIDTRPLVWGSVTLIHVSQHGVVVDCRWEVRDSNSVPTNSVTTNSAQRTLFVVRTTTTGFKLMYCKLLLNYVTQVTLLVLNE